MSRMPFFLRFDDITDLDDRIVYFVETSLVKGFPVLVAVIPEQLDSDTAAWLIALRRQYPLLLDIAQHGYRHQDHFSGDAHGEFCRERSDKQIEDDIAAGARIMDNAFGGEWQRIFVPPFNHVSRHAVRTIIRMHFLGVSTIYFPANSLRERFSMCRDMLAYRCGGALPAWRNMWQVEGQLPCVSPAMDTVADYAAAQLVPISELNDAAMRFIACGEQAFGIMIHHWIYRDMAEIDALIEWVECIRDRCSLYPASVSQLMRGFP
ncbi:MAG: DUF2334 domain-containing protein [Mariprofundaceae bacterium]